jgi:hypothetical protein
MHKFLLTLISLVCLGALVACGSSSSASHPVQPTQPTGGNNAGFTTASLSGTYVFAVNGVTQNTNFAAVGTLTADGAGKITAGTRDTINNTGSKSLGETLTGTYTVNQDGRGQAVINGSLSQSIYSFVLSSPSGGKLFQAGATSNSVVVDAVGTLELQTGAPAFGGTYIVRLDGEDSSHFPYAAIGGLTAGANAITGTIDENDSGTPSLLFASTGTYTFSGTTGTASFTTPTGGTHNFNVYYVSPNRLELLCTDTASMWFLYGNADLQTSVAGTAATFAGNQVLNLSGYDSTGSVQETGRLTLDGAGNLANAVKDYNENGTFYPGVTSTGNYTVAANGRWTAATTPAGASIASEGIVGWQVSPQHSLVMVTRGANPSVSGYTILETGDMRAQTLGLSNASITGNYAQAFAGFDYGGLGNFESIGNYLADGNGGLAGTIDFQTDSEGFIPNSSQSGPYAVDPTLGRGTATVSGVTVVFYTVDASDIYMISTLNSSAYQGTLTLQSTTIP